MYRDESLNCTDCSRPFAFTASEQEFFAAKGFTNKPNRCPDCRAARKAQRAGSGGGAARGGDVRIPRAAGGGHGDRAPIAGRR